MGRFPLSTPSSVTQVGHYLSMVHAILLFWRKLCGHFSELQQHESSFGGCRTVHHHIARMMPRTFCVRSFKGVSSARGPMSSGLPTRLTWIPLTFISYLEPKLRHSVKNQTLLKVSFRLSNSLLHHIKKKQLRKCNQTFWSRQDSANNTFSSIM